MTPRNDSIDSLTYRTVSLRGRDHYVFSDGTVLPKVAGGDGSGDGGNGNGGNGGSGSGGSSGGDGGGTNGGGAPEKKFTQEELDSIVQGRLARHAESVYGELAKKWGVTIEEAEQIVTAHKEKSEGEKSEAQKAKDAADKARADAETAAQTAKREAHEAKVERALVRAGVPITAEKPEDQEILEKKLAKIVGLVEAEVGADDAEIAKAVTALKETMPEVFPGASATTTFTPPGVTPKLPVKQSKEPKDAMTAGAERAKARANAANGYAWETPAQATT